MQIFKRGGAQFLANCPGSGDGNLCDSAGAFSSEFVPFRQAADCGNGGTERSWDDSVMIAGNGVSSAWTGYTMLAHRLSPMREAWRNLGLALNLLDLRRCGSKVS